MSLQALSLLLKQSALGWYAVLFLVFGTLSFDEFGSKSVTGGLVLGFTIKARTRSVVFCPCRIKPLSAIEHDDRSSCVEHDELSESIDAQEKRIYDSNRRHSSYGHDAASPTTRRTVGKKVMTAAGASALAITSFGINNIWQPQPARAMLEPFTTEPQTIVITGCNSGIGLDAATRLANRGHTIILACRTLAKAQGAAESILQSSNLDGNGKSSIKADNLIPMEGDLASLKSISNFVNDLQSKLGNQKIDIVALNAGLARDTSAKDVLRTQEGFELTVGTNHLGHFFLTQKILPLIRTNGRIVVTASSVHDPESPGGAQGSKATLGDLSGLINGPYFDMVDGGAFDADKAYKDSKLCNVLFTRELQRRLAADGSKIVVNCFSPGLIVGTGLFRDQNPIFTKVFDIAATNLLKVGETTHYGGGALEYMCLDKTVGMDGNGGKYYFSQPGSSKYGEEAYGVQFQSTSVSKEAQDDKKAVKLWEISSKLVGLS